MKRYITLNERLMNENKILDDSKINLKRSHGKNKINLFEIEIFWEPSKGFWEFTDENGRNTEVTVGIQLADETWWYFENLTFKNIINELKSNFETIAMDSERMSGMESIIVIVKANDINEIANYLEKKFGNLLHKNPNLEVVYYG